MIEKLNEIERKFEALEADYNDPNIVSNPREMQRVGKQRAELEPIVGAIGENKQPHDPLRAAKKITNNPKKKNPALAKIEPLKGKITALKNPLKGMLVPKAPNDDNPVIVETRPAAGGDEAALFA